MRSQSTARLSMREKVGYAMGDVGNAFSWSFVTSFLMLYYTDVMALPATAVATLFLVTRFWDAINDPLIGSLSDRTNSKRGRYRPWLLYGALPLAICTALVFYNPVGLQQHWKLLYAYLTYSLMVLAYTAVNIPYTALSATMTLDSHERGSLAGLRLTFSTLGAMLVAQIGTYLVPALDYTFCPGQGFFTVAVLLGLIACTCYLITYRTTTERILPEAKQNHLPLRKQISAILQNKPLLLATLVHFLVGMTVYGKMAVMAYYFKYNVGNYGMLAIFTLVMQGSMACGSMLSPKLSDLLKGKGRALSLSFICYGIFSLLNATVTPVSSPVLFWLLVALSNLCHGSGFAISYAVIPDTVEYGMLKSGVRTEGLITAVTSFFNKIGMAIGTSLTAFVLGILQYNPNGTQSAATLSAINIIMFVVSGVSAILIGILFLAYKLDYRTCEQILQKLHISDSQPDK